MQRRKQRRKRPLAKPIETIQTQWIATSHDDAVTKSDLAALHERLNRLDSVLRLLETSISDLTQVPRGGIAAPAKVDIAEITDRVCANIAERLDGGGGADIYD